MLKSIKTRLIVMNILQWAVWGSYLTSMANYLGNAGLGEHIGIFFALQGIVSIFMPTIMGIVADKWIPAQKLLGICHGIAALGMLGAGYYGWSQSGGGEVSFAILFSLYAVGTAFYMPTIALSNSVAFNLLERNGYDTVKDFPPIRVFGTVGFILAMLFVNFVSIEGIQFQNSYNQFLTSGYIGLAMLIFCFTLPNCPCNTNPDQNQTLSEKFGLNAFVLFKDKQMAIFFIFSMLLGAALQVTNAYATPFISHFQVTSPDSWGANNANAIYSVSQVAETLGILLIPFAMKKFGIKNVMLIAMGAWVLRFGLFGTGDTGSGVWMIILSCIVYGVAFDFFNISGALYTNSRTKGKLQNSAQGLFMLMTNGIGATVGTLTAQAIVNKFTHEISVDGNIYRVGDWPTAWFIFAGYALVVGILFFILFKKPKGDEPLLG
jgi:nucleoside transporter